MTRAPSRRMRKTLSAWRSTSSSPMYTVHSSPSRAAAVAVATPCWPAPVSATSRVLPMRLVSSAWPSTLLILCEPVWLRSSRLSRSRIPSWGPRLVHSVSRAGPPGVVGERGGELGPEAGAGPRLPEALVQLVAGGDQRLGDLHPAVVAEAAGGTGVPHHGGSGGVGHLAHSLRDRSSTIQSNGR